MADDSQAYRVMSLFDWTKGVMDRSENPLAVLENSLACCVDVDTSGYGLKVRDGASVVSRFAEGSKVRFMTGVHLPTSGAEYLIAQVDDSNGVSRLFAADLKGLSSGLGLEWREIYSLGEGAGAVSVACLNDRAVITEGKRCPPLVFSGCLDDTGLDWAVPKAVMVTYNAGLDWDDLTDAVCDSDPETAAIVETLPQGSWIAVCCDAPLVEGFLFDIADGAASSNSLIVEGYAETWVNDGLWSDGTSGMTGSGLLTHSGAPFRSAYHSLNNSPGFWFRFRFNTTFGGASIRRILVRSPCQELSVIGDGLFQKPLGFLFHDTSDNSIKDFTVEVSDYNYPTFARLNDGALENPVGMRPSDAIFVGYLTRFSSVELTLHNDFGNGNPATMNGAYWNGTSWAPLTGFMDTTADSNGATLSVSGLVSWKVPDDWKNNRPLNMRQPYGYWIRLSVSGELTPKTFITEAAVSPVMDRLKKSAIAVTVRDRVVLMGRSDAPDQIDVSRPLEEYGFFGEESASFRIGGQGAIVAAVEAFNQGFIAKSEDWFLLNGYSPSTFSVERAEAAGQVPVNSRVIVRAPHAESDMKNLMGVYYINASGAWYFAGLKVYRISEHVSWWDRSMRDTLKIDTESLDKACGVYLPDVSRVIWSVPMKGPGLVSDGKNNRLIVYDLKNKSWLGPYSLTLSVVSLLSTKAGAGLVLGADHDGRILRLFDPDSRLDVSTVINGQACTQWLNFGSPHMIKRLRSVTLHGKGAETPVSVQVFADGSTTPSAVLTFGRGHDPNAVRFLCERRSCDVSGRFFRFAFSFNAPALIHGIQVGFSALREWSLSSPT